MSVEVEVVVKVTRKTRQGGVYKVWNVWSVFPKWVMQCDSCKMGVSLCETWPLFISLSIDRLSLFPNTFFITKLVLKKKIKKINPITAVGLILLRTPFDIFLEKCFYRRHGKLFYCMYIIVITNFNLRIWCSQMEMRKWREMGKWRMSLSRYLHRRTLRNP